MFTHRLFASAALSTALLSGCNTTEGQCWVPGTGGEGGVIVPGTGTGVGGFGDVPPEGGGEYVDCDAMPANQVETYTCGGLITVALYKWDPVAKEMVYQETVKLSVPSKEYDTTSADKAYNSYKDYIYNDWWKNNYKTAYPDYYNKYGPDTGSILQGLDGACLPPSASLFILEGGEKDREKARRGLARLTRPA